MAETEMRERDWPKSRGVACDVIKCCVLTYVYCSYEKKNQKRSILEEASTHKSAKTHADKIFVTRDLDL